MTTAQKLLQKAKARRQQVVVPVQDYVDLWLAVINNEIDPREVIPVLGFSGKEYGRYYNWFHATGKRLVKQNLVRLYKVER